MPKFGVTADLVNRHLGLLVTRRIAEHIFAGLL
jgi:hypothetical protein